MVDFEIAVINALESTFMSVVSGCFFSKHLSEDPINTGFTNQYIEDLYRPCSPIENSTKLAFVPKGTK